MSRFRKRPVEIDAFLWTGGEDQTEDPVWIVDAIRERRVLFCGTGDNLTMVISTLEGNMVAHPGDWIVRGVKDELYPVRADIFAATYEAVA